MAKATPKKAAPKASPKEQLGFIDSAQDTLEDFQVSTKEMAIPFVRILQPLSPQLDKKNDESFIEGAEAGHFFNTVTKEIYGETVGLIPLKFQRIYIEWRPERGGLVDYHSPENAEQIAVDKSQFGKWLTEEGNILQENYTYLCLIDGHESEGICILSLASTMIKTAKEWNKLATTQVMDNGKVALPYYAVWEMSTVYKQNDKGNWYVPVVRFDHWITEQQYKILSPERKALPSVGSTDYAQLEDKSRDTTEATGQPRATDAADEY